ARVVFVDDVPTVDVCIGGVGREHSQLDVRDGRGFERRRRLGETRVLEGLNLREVPEVTIRVRNRNRVGCVEANRARGEQEDVQRVLGEVVLRRMQRNFVVI